MNRLHLSALLLATAALSDAIVASAAPLSPRRQGDIVYVSGGVGANEAAAFEKATVQYPLTLEFVAGVKPDVEFLADVQVSIKDKHGRDVLTTVSDGPLVLVKPPPGQYQISATYRGATEQRVLKIGKTDHRRLVFQWSAAPSVERIYNVREDLMVIHARGSGRVF